MDFRNKRKEPKFQHFITLLVEQSMESFGQRAKVDVSKRAPCPRWPCGCRHVAQEPHSPARSASRRSAHRDHTCPARGTSAPTGTRHGAVTSFPRHHGPRSHSAAAGQKQAGFEGQLPRCFCTASCNFYWSITNLCSAFLFSLAHFSPFSWHVIAPSLAHVVPQKLTLSRGFCL